MIKTFTQEDLIRYVYKEAPEHLHEQITQALCTDEELAEQCAQLLQTQHKLDELTRTPSARSVSSILEYSRNFNLQS